MNNYNPMPPPVAPQNSNKKLIIAIVVLSLLLVGGGVTLLLLSNKSDSTATASETLNGGDLTTAEIDAIDEPTGMGTTDDDDALSADDNDPEVQQLSRRLSGFKYATYHNQRYGYLLQVPDFMAPGPESQNGDGCKFFYNGISLSAYASHNALDYDVAQQMELVDANRQANRQTMGDNAFLLSGREADGTRYELKSVLKDEVWFTVRLNYPAKFSSVIAPLSQIVSGFEP